MRRKPVRLLLTSTTASGMVAWDGSVAVPVKTALSSCAKEATANTDRQDRIAKTRRAEFITPLCTKSADSPEVPLAYAHQFSSNPSVRAEGGASPHPLTRTPLTADRSPTGEFTGSSP